VDVAVAVDETVGVFEWVAVGVEVVELVAV
jgi:hypothetical protein